MVTFSLKHLDDTEFENFCYDLLCQLNFENVSWRKGTALSSSPSDRGRDIECQIHKVDIDGRKFTEKWFVECKHYVKGVPPTAFQSVLAWAEAEDPDVILIATSGFLSNPAKDHLTNYTKNRSPRFRIKIWEKPDLEKLTLGKARLQRKYNISGEFPILSVLHPAHVLYMKELTLNTFDYLFAILNNIDPEKRDSVFSWIYDLIIRPKSTYHTSTVAGMEITIRDRTLEEVSYEAFKQKCYEISDSNVIEEPLLVFLIVNWVLQLQLGISDITSVDEFAHKLQTSIDYFNRILANKPEDRHFRETVAEGGIDVTDTEFFERSIQMYQERIEQSQEVIERNYELYEYFCENVLGELLKEKLLTR